MADKKRIICLNTGEVFESMAAAAKSADVQPCEMSKAINGKRKTIRGKIYEALPDQWDYQEEAEIEYAAKRILIRSGLVKEE